MACMPPMLPPVAHRIVGISSASSSHRCASIMSATVTTGNDSPYGRPVSGLIEDGPVLPEHPPITLEHRMK
jgi:hypothetical protein